MQSLIYFYLWDIFPGISLNGLYFLYVTVTLLKAIPLTISLRCFGWYIFDNIIGLLAKSQTELRCCFIRCLSEYDLECVVDASW